MTLQRGWNNKSKLLVVRFFPYDQFWFEVQSMAQLFNLLKFKLFIAPDI